MHTYVCMSYVCTTVHMYAYVYHNIIGTAAYKESQRHHSEHHAAGDNTGQNFLFKLHLYILLSHFHIQKY